MKCRICHTQAQPLFSTLVLNKYQVGYYECPTCGFVQTEDPYWLSEAYSYAFTATDTGTLQRTLTLGKSAVAVAYFLFNRKARFVDYAGGYGTLARMMRDIGFDYYTTDLYAPNVMARGFDAEPGRYEAATAFECFEHFVDPRQELEKMLAYSDTIFFTTQLCPRPAPGPADWWYYAQHHGQHIALYRPETLRYLGEQYGLTYHHVLNYHLFTKKKRSGLAFRFLVLAGRLGLHHVARWTMRSRTLSDAALLENRPQTHPIAE